MENPAFQIKVLESTILKIKEEMTQTTLPEAEPAEDKKKSAKK
jgi:hypothetical protein